MQKRRRTDWQKEPKKQEQPLDSVQDTVFQYEETQHLQWQRKARNILARFVNIKKFQESLGYQQEMSYRLLKEVSNSIDIALMLRKKIPNKQITIHIDVNENQKHKSSAHTKRLVSFVKAMGFVCETKPNSWASFSVADKFTK